MYRDVASVNTRSRTRGERCRDRSKPSEENTWYNGNYTGDIDKILYYIDKNYESSVIILYYFSIFIFLIFFNIFGIFFKIFVLIFL